MNSEKLEWDFGYHAPDTAKRLAHEGVRENCLVLAIYLNENIPGDSREKSLAITKLEEVMLWANAALARNPRPKGTL